MKRLSYVCLIGLFAATFAPVGHSPVFAVDVFSDDFSGPNGTLVGTIADIGGSWTQTGTNATSAIQTSGGAVALATIGQDAFAAFSSPVPKADGSWLKTSLDLTVTAAQATGDYFLHLSDPLGSTTNFYQRLFARSSAGGYQLGLLDTSGTGSTTTWGSHELSFGSTYHVDVMWDFASGISNDTFSVALDNAPYLTHTWSSALGEPAQLAAVNLRQGNATTTVPTLTLDNLVVATAVAPPPPPPPAVTPYSFTNIIDSTVAAPTGNYVNISDAAINGNKVAFKAGYNQGFFGIIDSIFTSTGGQRTEIAQELSTAPTGGLFADFGRPSISGNAVVFLSRYSFSAQIGSEGVAIFSGSGTYSLAGPQVSIVIDPSTVGVPYNIVADPLLSDGVLAFRGSTSTFAVPDALYASARIVGNGDPAPPGDTFSSIDANYGASGDIIAFRGFYGSQEGIFSGSGGPLKTIAKEGDATPLGGTFNTVLDPAVSGETVAFLGTFAGGSGIFAGNGGAISTIVKTGDTTPGGHTFSSFSVPTISGDLVAFRGNYAGGSGLYAKNGDELSKVVEIGDPLFGSSVTSFTFSDLGLDPGGSGNLAFAYSLADGRSGVTMAYIGSAQPTVYQWEYVNANVPAQGRRLSATPVPDSAGIVAVPALVFADRDFTMAYLIGADLRNAVAHNANLTNADLRGSDLTSADLSHANLTGAVLDSTRLNGASFVGAEVRGASFRRTSVIILCPPGNPGNSFCMPQVKSEGGIAPAQLYLTASYQAHDLTGINLAGNTLTDANLAGQNLTGADLTGALLAGANLAGAEIRGASFGRFSITSGCDGKGSYNSCRAVTSFFGTGITLSQITASASYLNHDLAGIDFSGNNLTGANLVAQNLMGVSFFGANLGNANLSHTRITDVDFRNSSLTGANLTGADARGASLTDSLLAGAVVANLIRSDGHVYGLDLVEGEVLLVRDYDGDSASGVAPISITMDQDLDIGAGGILRIMLESDAWNSTISFAAGIPVALGGNLELLFADGTDLASQVGRSFELFHWAGVDPTGAFDVVSPFTWNLSNLYTTGQITLIGVPEPSALYLLCIGLTALVATRRRYWKDPRPECRLR